MNGMSRTRGPAKKRSAAEEIRQGRPGHRPVNDQEPKPVAPTAGELAAFALKLCEGARAVWDQDAPVALAMGTLTRADLTSFGTYCRLQAFGDAFASTAEDRLGATVSHARKKARPRRTPPTFSSAVKAWEKAQALAGRFGLNPSDRTRIKVTKDHGHQDPVQAARDKVQSVVTGLHRA
jgi:phage terminase small subunit